MWRTISATLVIVAALAVISHQASSEEKAMDMQAAMKKWMDAATPGEKHKKLEYFVGEWTTETSIRMMPNAPPTVTKGEATTRWLMPGRWLITETKGSLMGRPHHSVHITGYDNFRKKYVVTVVDNMNTHMLQFAGNWSRDGKSLVTYGEMNEPMTGEVNKMVKSATRIEGEDQHRLEVYDLVIGEGEEAKVFTITYKRKK